MEFKSQRTKRELDIETVEKYERVYQELLKDIQSTAKILAAFGKNANSSAQVRLRPAVTAPIHHDVRAFLRESGKPTYQSVIIEVLGDDRHAKYPTLLRPYQDVWKSLEYQARNNLEIVPVQWRGNRLVQVELKQKPRLKQVAGGTEDSAELYLKPDNLFWFRAEISKMRRGKK